MDNTTVFFKINVTLEGERKFGVSAFTRSYDFGGGKKKHWTSTGKNLQRKLTSW